MRNSARVATLATLVALASLAACGSGVNETAATMTYNARYVGAATLSAGSGTLSDVAQTPLGATLSMSQLASTVTGTIVVTGVSGTVQDTLLSAGVMGHATSTGLDVTMVQTAGCAMHLTGPLMLQPDGSLTGTLIGSDCNAAGKNDLQLALSLTRQ